MGDRRDPDRGRQDEPDREQRDRPDIGAELAERREEGRRIEERWEEGDEDEVGWELELREPGDEADREPADHEKDRVRNAKHRRGRKHRDGRGEHGSSRSES